MNGFIFTRYIIIIIMDIFESVDIYRRKVRDRRTDGSEYSSGQVYF